jgi:hypothetical protein
MAGQGSYDEFCAMTASRWGNPLCDRANNSRAQKQGDENMLGIIAAVLIVLWLLGFFAFHVTTGVVHIVLVAGIVLLLVHFLRGSSGTA